MIKDAIKKCFKTMDRKGWDEVYWAFDLHETIVYPEYDCDGIPTTFYPLAKSTLQQISKRKDIKMIMYTCSHPTEQKKYLEFFESQNIHFDYVNDNPLVKTGDDSYGYYDQKFYMNVLLEDKSGFNADKDWLEVKNALETNWLKKFDNWFNFYFGNIFSPVDKLGKYKNKNLNE